MPPKPKRQTVLFEDVTRKVAGQKKEDLGPYTQQFEKWWNLYPLKVQKRNAFAAFNCALHRVTWEELMRKTMVLAETSKARGKYCPYPSTFLNQDRWEDDPKAWADPSTQRKTVVDWDYKS